jgi:hypothetical protein
VIVAEMASYMIFAVLSSSAAKYSWQDFKASSKSGAAAMRRASASKFFPAATPTTEPLASLMLHVMPER